MNPEAVKLAYELFQKDGYTGSQQQFVSLINENSKALDLAHSLFSQEGYTDGLDRFSGLMGVGKKKRRGITFHYSRRRCGIIIRGRRRDCFIGWSYSN